MLRLWLILLALMLACSPAAAQSSAPRISTNADRAVIEFLSGDYQAGPGIDTAALPWTPGPTPNVLRMSETKWRSGDYHAMTGRFRFSRALLAPGSLSLETNGTRNEFSVFLNGREIFRNFAHLSDQKLAWYRPYFVPLPADQLRPGENEVLIRAVSQDSVGIGRVLIGVSPVIQRDYQFRFFWQITAPLAANFAMLVLGGLTFLLWLGRRREIELFYLSLSSLLWYLRNYQYFAEVTPFTFDVFNALTVYATYFASVATAAFYVTFLKLSRPGHLLVPLFLVGIPLVLLHTIFALSNLFIYIGATVVSLGVGLLGLNDLRRNYTAEHIPLAVIMPLMPLASIYDFYLNGVGRGWEGFGFYIAVFGGFLYCIAFLLSFGLRALGAFRDLATANETLEQRIAQTRAELAASELARQQLVVGDALRVERERLMQEMHDGIGSNLITALAIAKQQGQSSSTIRTLQRALSDLKITVDSLEPVEGDIVALIGNLRHRMAGDLRDAGIVCRWDARPCDTIPWLDATNALHVLRIFQEAIGNALTHSHATELEIGCREETRALAHAAAAPGIAAYVTDNGRGFAMESAASAGRGLSNITSRARSLHGQLDCRSAIGAGTTVTLWLPYARAAL